MSRSSTLILLGILVILVPFSGLPISLRSFLAVLLGACVFGIGFTLRTHEVKEIQQSPPPPPAPLVPAEPPQAF